MSEAVHALTMLLAMVPNRKQSHVSHSKMRHVLLLGAMQRGNRYVVMGGRCR